MCSPVVSVSSSAMRAVWLRRWAKSGEWAGLRMWSESGGSGVLLEAVGMVVAVGWVESADCVANGCCVSCGGGKCDGLGCASGGERGVEFGSGGGGCLAGSGVGRFEGACGCGSK